MKHIIDKAIDFCYGHRVWTQQLDAEYSIDTCTKCRHIHGHQARVQIFLEAKKLNPQAMVVDFKMTNWLKKFVDEYLDHKFIVDINDPLYDRIVGTRILLPVFIQGVKKPVGDIIDLGDHTANYAIDDPARYVIEGVDREYLESFFVVNFVPTSENLSKWIWSFSKEKMKKIGNVVRIDWHETPKSRASFME